MKIEFDFDKWAQLYKSDPKAFEQEREKLLNDVIDSSNHKQRRRLLGIKFKLNSQRSYSRSDTYFLITSSELMWDSFRELNTELQPFLHSAIGQKETTKKVKLHVVKSQPYEP